MVEFRRRSAIEQQTVRTHAFVRTPTMVSKPCVLSSRTVVGMLLVVPTQFVMRKQRPMWSQVLYREGEPGGVVTGRVWGRRVEEGVLVCAAASEGPSGKKGAAGAGNVGAPQ